MSKQKTLGNPLLLAKAAQNKNVQTAGIVLIGGAALGGILLIRKLLQQLNIIDDAADAAVEKAQFSDAFNASWWRTEPKNKGFAVFTAQSAATQAAKIENAITGVTNSFGVLADFADVMAVFKSCRSKMHVSRIADEYQKQFGADMYTQLQNRLLNSDLAQIVAYVKQLPDRVKI